jgi:Putative Flp pilus-assembly TadE/G-like
MLSLRRNETGAVAIIVAVVVGMGVLLGAAAISIDVGSLYAQRRQVQNGADAAALSLAETCVRTGQCNISLAPSLSTLAGQNGMTTLGDVNNQPSYAVGLCRNFYASTATASNLPLCNASSGTFVDCPALPSSLAGVPYVEAHTQTLINGTHVLPPVVAQALGFGGSNVQACARAAFGQAGSAAENTLPITMSYCDWKSAVGYVDALHPGTFQLPPKDPWPGYNTTSDPTTSNPWPSAEVSVDTAKNSGATCPTWNGHTAPGGFSWLNLAGSTCSANVVNGWVDGIPGNNYNCDLTPYYGKMVFLPIFDCVTDVIVNPIIPDGQPNATNCTTAAHGSSNTHYHIVGYATFYLSGWHFSGGSGASDGSIKPPNSAPCPGSGRCMTGWFTQGLMNNATIAPPGGGTPDFGPKVVLPAG